MSQCEQSDKLDQFQIETLRGNIKGAVTNLWADEAARRLVHGRIDSLCDMALETIAPSSTAAQEVVEQAYQHAASAIGVVLSRGGFSDDCIRWTVENLAAHREQSLKSLPSSATVRQWPITEYQLGCILANFGASAELVNALQAEIDKRREQSDIHGEGQKP